MTSTYLSLLLVLAGITAATSVTTAGQEEPSAPRLPRAYTIPVVDIAHETARRIIIDREEGQYLGHPTTVLLEDGKTMICVYPKGHGRGEIVMKRSGDGGRSWSERLPVPESWKTSREVPTIHRVFDGAGRKRLIIFSGLYPIRMAHSEDDGATWSELEPIGDFGGIVAMGCVVPLKEPGIYMALFHDDGRFLDGSGGRGGKFHVFKTVSRDGGMTWSAPIVIARHERAHLCEPGFIRSPDGRRIAVLLRENSRKLNSFLIHSDDEGETWSEPRQLPAALTGDRHTLRYAKDGRIFATFRDTTLESPTKGDWVGWVGTFDDIMAGREGEYRVRLMDNKHRWDCAYPGLELLPDGTFVTTTYGHWEEGARPYVVNVRFRLDELDRRARCLRARNGPAPLLPEPKDIVWREGSFDLNRPIRCALPFDPQPSSSREKSSSREDTATVIFRAVSDCIKECNPSGPSLSPLTGPKTTEGPFSHTLSLERGTVPGAPPSNDEAYLLEIDTNLIRLTAPSPVGLFNGLQTIRQLAFTDGDGVSLHACRIVDWPAFPMRGVMFDVGRNFISIPNLKKAIDRLSRYKMNVLHFHLTEHIGWRFQSISHPELTAPEVQLRNKGKFYTPEEIREFVDWCGERFVTVIPEIDMPGHSDAFKRATGVSMESPEGMAILTDVIGEVCDLFDAPYVHLGSDEVRIRNPDFIPAMARVVRGRGKEVILWRPGGPLDGRTVYQLWHSGKAEPDMTVIDSRDYYMNHLDWFSGVRRIFNTKICDVDNGSARHLGGIACLWPDRRVAKEEDQFRTSPFWPLALTMAERTWCGGGMPSLKRKIAPPGTLEHDAFASFEDRLVRHRDRFPVEIPFAYVRQSKIVWRVCGPFPNGGETARVFPPENGECRTCEIDGTTYEPRFARGATVLFGGWGNDGLFGPMRNRTAYAVTFAHVPQAREAHIWIGFRSWSRSHRDDTPKRGAWDHRDGAIRLNGAAIPPPAWAKPGRKGNSEDPLIDEGYAYRPPTPVSLQAGWNRIVVKVPVGKDKTKWMFTAALVDWDGSRARELEGLTWAASPEKKNE
jgi:hypothetical protein